MRGSSTYISPTLGIALLFSMLFGLFYLFGTMVETQDLIFTRMALELDHLIETAYSYSGQ
jgi:hypothetical protein